MFEEPAADGVTSFMISDDLLFIRGDDLVLLLETTDDPVHGVLEVFHLYHFFSLTGGDEGRLVADIGDVRAGKTGCLLGQLMDIQLAGDLYRFEVYFEDGFTSFEIGLVDRDLPVKAAGAQKRGVEDVGAVGRGQHDDPAVAA